MQKRKEPKKEKQEKILKERKKCRLYREKDNTHQAASAKEKKRCKTRCICSFYPSHTGSTILAPPWCSEERIIQYTGKRILRKEYITCFKVTISTGSTSLAYFFLLCLLGEVKKE